MASNSFPRKIIASSRLSALLRLSVIAAGVFLLSGCEAPLVLDGVEQQKQATTLRYDQLQDVEAIGKNVVVVGSKGAVITSADRGETWKRQVLKGEPSLIDVASCGDQGFVALDINRGVWMSDASAQSWTQSMLETPETPLTVDCTDAGKIWVGGSFSSFWSSSDQGKSWQETTLNEDLMFTSVQFLDAENAYAVGEFGTVVKTTDGGANWEMLEPLPNEFHPLAAKFVSVDEGWVAGLNGTVLYTHDGGASWNRAETPVEAPIYGLAAGKQVVYATGDHGSLIVSHDGVSWQRAAASTKTLSYLRGITALDDGQLVVAGGGGVLARIDPNSQTAALTATPE